MLLRQYHFLPCAVEIYSRLIIRLIRNYRNARQSESKQEVVIFRNFMETSIIKIAREREENIYLNKERK